MNHACMDEAGKVMDGQPILQQDARPWRRAFIWLLLLGPFFFISYGSANWLASQKPAVLHIVFDWEHYIPFIPWTIIPYWSIDALYVISLFICSTKTELDSHAKRLLTAQLVAVACFILMPMGFSFERPEIHGFFGSMFVALSSFDQPYNQAPSLHIALLVILWFVFARHLSRLWLWLFHLLAVLIAISVLTTYQHHFIDVPTGALLGLFCVWLWPNNGDKMFNSRNYGMGRSAQRIGVYYFMAFAGLSLLALMNSGAALWLFWPAVSLLFVSVFYVLTGVVGFQKNSQGKINLVVRFLLLPYLMAAKLNSRHWTLRDASANQITDSVYLGRFPSKKEIAKNDFRVVIDLTAELVVPNTNIHWCCVPCLDLLTPEYNKIRHTVELIEQYQAQGPLLVSCALGYSRSAIAVIAWLLVTHRETNLDSAIARIKRQRPSIVLKQVDRNLLERFVNMENCHERQA